MSSLFRRNRHGSQRPVHDRRNHQRLPNSQNSHRPAPTTPRPQHASNQSSETLQKIRELSKEIDKCLTRRCEEFCAQPQYKVPYRESTTPPPTNSPQQDEAELKEHLQKNFRVLHGLISERTRGNVGLYYPHRFDTSSNPSTSRQERGTEPLLWNLFREHLLQQAIADMNLDMKIPNLKWSEHKDRLEKLVADINKFNNTTATPGSAERMADEMYDFVVEHGEGGYLPDLETLIQEFMLHFEKYEVVNLNKLETMDRRALDLIKQVTAKAIDERNDYHKMLVIMTKCFQDCTSMMRDYGVGRSQVLWRNLLLACQELERCTSELGRR